MHVSSAGKGPRTPRRLARVATRLAMYGWRPSRHCRYGITLTRTCGPSAGEGANKIRKQRAFSLRGKATARSEERREAQEHRHGRDEVGLCHRCGRLGLLLDAPYQRPWTSALCPWVTGSGAARARQTREKTDFQTKSCFLRKQGAAVRLFRHTSRILSLDSAATSPPYRRRARRPRIQACVPTGTGKREYETERGKQAKD